MARPNTALWKYYTHLVLLGCCTEEGAVEAVVWGWDDDNWLDDDDAEWFRSDDPLEGEDLLLL